MVHRQRIRLEESEEPQEAKSGVCGLPSIDRRERQLSLPAQDVLLQALEVARGPEELARLREMAATYQDVAQRLKVAREELVRLAIWRIDVERKLGEELAQTVVRGGSGSNLHAASSKRGGSSRGLPEGVNWSASKRYQDLAVIPESVLSDYYARAAARGSIPTPGGARSYAARQKGVVPSVREPRALRATRTGSQVAPAAQLSLSPEVLDAVVRFFGVIDVVVGDVDLPCHRRCRADVVNAKMLQGAVFVAECPNPEEWLPKLAAARIASALKHVLVVLPAHTGAAWFRESLASGWAACFLPCVRRDEEARMVLYHGPYTAPWDLVFGRVGAVVRGGAASQ